MRIILHTSNMNFNTFCNICFTKGNIIKLCEEENEPILNILISFTSSPDIVNGIIYLCINCCNKLEEYDNFRELFLTNFVRFRYLYNEQKKQLEIRNTPDIEIQLKAFVDVNVERPSGTPLIDNYEVAQALRNDTCDVDNTYKLESDGELTKIDLGELLNKNNLGHADISSTPENSTLENATKTCLEKYESDCFIEDQGNNASSVVKKCDDELTKIDFNELLNKNELSHADISCTPENDTLQNDPNACLEKYKNNCFGKGGENNGSNVKRCTGREKKTATSNIVLNICDEDFDLYLKRFQCHKCNNIFTDRAKLKTHKCIHTVEKREKPFKCEECGFRFTQRANLKTHQRIHTGEKPYECEECSMAFTRRDKLETHKFRHTDEKPYKCDYCGLRFRKPYSLKVHERIHTGEKPYKCDHCDCRFTRSCNLKTHKRTHTGEKPYKCDECGIGFTKASILKTHKRIHSGEKPYKCDECDYRFTKKCNLITHKLIHTDKKPYVCDECGLGFLYNSSLIAHKRVHTGEKPHNSNNKLVTNITKIMSSNFTNY